MSPQRTLWSDLRAIDRAVVPRLAAFGLRLQRAWRDLPGTVRGARSPGHALDQLDGRYARRGALALVRDVPQLGWTVLAVLLVAAAATVAVRSGGSSTDASGGLDLPAVSGPRTLTVGPIAGGVADYLAGARADLLARAQQTPKEPTFAIADFERGLTPADAAAAVPAVEVRQVFLRVPAGGTTQFFPSIPAAGASGVDFGASALTKPLEVSGLPGGARAAYDAVAAALVDQAKSNEEFVKSIDALPSPTADDIEQRASQSADARRFRAAAAALHADCACIYAVVVHGQARTLANIANSGRVRVVQAALSGVAYERISWVPLSPDLKDGDEYHPGG